MAITHLHIAALAVFVVIAVVGTGLLTGGAVTTNTDLWVSGVSLPNKILAGQTVRPVATFVNSGTASAGSVSYRLQILTSSYGLAMQKDERVYLLAGGTATADLGPWDLPRGDYILNLWVDYQGEHTETNEVNNYYTTKFTVN